MDDDGQLLVICGFIMATGLILLTIMLNSVIYTSNTAYEDTMSSHDKDILYINDLTLRESQNAYLKAGGDSAKYNAYMADYSEYLEKLCAYKGISVSISYLNGCNFGDSTATTVVYYSDGSIKSKYTLVAACP